MEVKGPQVGSRKQLRGCKEDLPFAIEQELGKWGKDACLLPLSASGTDSEVSGFATSGKQRLILQRWSSKWSTYVDVSSLSELESGDKLTVVLQPTNTVTTSSEVREIMMMC